LLEQLKKHELRALFFVTGHMAERIQMYPEILELLKEHEIGYHSSSHSVHPTIFEFTDVASYEEAYHKSTLRETSHINPLTGKIDGTGGILFLKKLFSSKQITAFRAPGFCWSPPHTEALRDLGIKFDFSSTFPSVPVRYKGLTFYPPPRMYDLQDKTSYYLVFLLSILRNRITIADLHPSLFVNQNVWDSIYHKGNPKQIAHPLPRSTTEINSLSYGFDLFLKRVKYLENTKLIETTPNLIESDKNLKITEKAVAKCYEDSIRWAKRVFNYKPKYLRNHFLRFFDADLLDEKNR
jgi:hypothetical protein